MEHEGWRIGYIKSMQCAVLGEKCGEWRAELAEFNVDFKEYTV